MRRLVTGTAGLVVALGLSLGAQEPAEGPPPQSQEEGAEETQQEDPPKPAPQPQPQPDAQEGQGPAKEEPAPEKPPPAEPAPSTPKEPPQDGGATPEAAAPTKSAAPAKPPAAAPAHPAVTWPLSIETLDLHLRGLAETHPEIARLEVLGTSAGGREILALRLGLGAETPEQEKPVLLLVDHQGPASAGAEALVELAWRLSVEATRDERTRNLLTRAHLVLVPALDPDVRAAVESTPPAVRFEQNFPSGWQPDSMRPGSGRTSLSKPETLAAARFLAGLKGCAVLLGFVAPAPRGAPYAGASVPGGDREVFARLGAALALDGARPLVPWYELGSPGGGLFDFAYQARGIYPLLFQLPAEDQLAAGGLTAFADEVSARVLRCLALLPRIEVTQESVERLASDTWQLDVRVQNVGIVPTSSALARREPLADVSLRLDGAKLIASARGPDFTDAALQSSAPVSAGTLAGGESRVLRLFLEGPSGAQVQVTTRSLWAGSDTLRVTLP